MKKTLLSFLTIAAVALQANAADLPTTGNVIAEYYTGNGQTFGGWGGSSKFENVDEDGKPCLKFTNEEATEYDWNVQMAIDYDFEPGTTYYIGFDIKGTPAEGITSAFQAKENYAGCGNLTNFDITADWKHVIIYGEPFDAGENGVSNPPMRWLANLGKYVGSFYLTNLKIYTEDTTGDDPGTEDPSAKDIVAQYYTGNGQTFGGWGGNAKFDNVDEDGKPCLQFTNPEASENDWSVQMAIDYEFVPGTKYYISFDIKGDAAEGITSGIQAKENYASCGDFNKFNITTDWSAVTIYCEPYDAGEGGVSNPPMRWVANLGKYVGTFYLTNLTIYTEKSSGVEAVAPVENGRTVVFNLHGIKVLDTDNKAEVYDLPAGIYIVNGKKIAVK
ncbi:hypothetical protein E5359_000430 [Bacteroidales bacterium]|jgi:hypothetical protein|nr:hypothetical protein E5984_02230 [Bacteroidales bacterium]TKC66053.1 hypothetical protein E5359_000430 [Bacteroidales bacterium]